MSLKRRPNTTVSRGMRSMNGPKASRPSASASAACDRAPSAASLSRLQAVASCSPSSNRSGDRPHCRNMGGPSPPRAPAPGRRTGRPAPGERSPHASRDRTSRAGDGRSPAYRQCQTPKYKLLLVEILRCQDGARTAGAEGGEEAANATWRQCTDGHMVDILRERGRGRKGAGGGRRRGTGVGRLENPLLCRQRSVSGQSPALSCKASPRLRATFEMPSTAPQGLCTIGESQWCLATSPYSPSWSATSACASRI